MSLVVRSRVSSPLLPDRHPDLQRPPHPCGINPCASAHWSGTSVRMDNPAPTTSYEPNFPNFYSYLNEEHTPICFLDSYHDFPCHDDATVISTMDPEGLPHSGPSSSSKHTAGSRVPSMFGPFKPPETVAGHVSGRSGIQETGAVSDRESVATTIFSPQKKRDRETNVVHSLKDKAHLQKILERKFDSAVRGERIAQH